MNIFLAFALCALIGYLLGSFSPGLAVGKFFGKMDIRSVGSKNAGTTNVLRTLGWLPSLLTFVGDALKGLISAWIGYLLAGVYGARVAGLMAIVGHNWPAYYRFKGGKGIATSFGVILALDPWIGLALFCLQVVVLAATKYMSVASITSAAALFVLTLIFRFGQWGAVLFSLVVAVLAIYSHRANIARLRRKEEKRLEFGKIKMFSAK